MKPKGLLETEDESKRSFGPETSGPGRAVAGASNSDAEADPG